MQSVIINYKMYTADRLWFAVLRDPQDEWGVGSDNLSAALDMLRRQGYGLICVIDDCKNPICLCEITYEDQFG